MEGAVWKAERAGEGKGEEVSEWEECECECEAESPRPKAGLMGLMGMYVGRAWRTVEVEGEGGGVGLALELEEEAVGVGLARRLGVEVPPLLLVVVDTRGLDTIEPMESVLVDAVAGEKQWNRGGTYSD